MKIKKSQNYSVKQKKIPQVPHQNLILVKIYFQMKTILIYLIIPKKMKKKPKKKKMKQII